MSLPLHIAGSHAVKVLHMIEEQCKRVQVCGSVLREKPYCGDAEVVVIPRNTRSLLARLDKLVHAGQLEKAIYGYYKSEDSVAKKPMYRWGEKYRGVSLPGTDGFKIEIFLANEHNWGYITWLRTGPGDANQYIMSRLMQSPFRFREGYGEYNGRRVSLPDETDLFKALGMPYISPWDRSVENYFYAPKTPQTPQWYEERYIHDDEDDKPMVQKGLF